MNLVLQTGNLTRDPETKVGQSGKQCTVFTIAVNRKYRNSEGKQDADFITFKCFDRTAENVAKFLKKGRKCNVIGHVQTGSYVNNEGKTVYTTQFIADDVEFLSTKQDSQEQAPTQETSSENKRYNPNGELPLPPAAPQGGGFVQVDEEDLPF